jgi:hypothetical protein
LCNTGEALLAAWLIERYFGSGFSLNRLRNVLGLLAAAVVTNAVGAVGATMAYKLLQGLTTPIWTIWQHWFASGSIGIITVAPLMIGLAETLRAPPQRSEIIEGVVRHDRAVVLAIGDGVIPRTGLAEVLLQEGQPLPPQIGAGEDAEPVHLVGSDRPDAMEFADRQGLDERRAHRGRHDELAVGLATVGGQFGEKLVVGDTG